MSTTNETGGDCSLHAPVGDESGYRPQDRLKTVQSTRDVNVWYLVTEADGIYVGTIDHIVGGAFAAGIVEAWNARCKSPTAKSSDKAAAKNL
jgi:hypothetical protein